MTDKAQRRGGRGFTFVQNQEDKDERKKRTLKKSKR